LTHWSNRLAWAGAIVLAAAGPACSADGASSPTPAAASAAPSSGRAIPVQRSWDDRPIPPDEFEIARLALREELRALLSARNYAEILRQLEADSHDGTRLSSGLWRSTGMLDALRDVSAEKAAAGGGWTPLMTELQELARQRPGAWLLFANALYAQAWEIRGAGYARDVGSGAMDRFRGLVRAARDTLDAHKPELAGLPDWYALRLDAALEAGEPEALRRRLFVEGMLRHPRFLQLYFSRLRHLVPQWGGSHDEMLDLLDQISRSTEPAVAEEGIYARLAWAAEQAGVGLLREPRLDGAAFDRAVDAVVDRYPAQRNLQRLFLMQCQRGNLPAMKRLLPRLKAPMSSELASGGPGQQSHLEQCQYLAAGASDEITFDYWSRGRPIRVRLQSPPPQPTDGPAASQRQERADARLALQQEVEILVSRNQFDKLMDRYALDVRDGARLPGGEWRSAATLVAFRQAALARVEADGDWRALLSALGAQSVRRPAVALLRAEALRTQAWTERDPGEANTLTPQALAAFHRRMREARDVLDLQAATLTRLPDWHTLRLAISHDLGEPEAAQRRLYTAAVARFPRYHALYAERMRQLAPRWGGSEDAMLDLLDEVAAAKDPAVADEGLYARLLIEAMRNEVALAGEPRLNVPALNRAIDLLVEREPVQHNLQPFFLLQCMREDGRNAIRLFPMLKRPLSEDFAEGGPLWGSYGSCLNWASAPAAINVSFFFTRRGQRLPARID